MSGVSSPKGILRYGWSARVDDYAIAGDWALDGDRFVVVDAAGGVFGLEGRSGLAAWEQPQVHAGGALALALHPAGKLVATAGQDGRVLIWTAFDGQVRRSIEVGSGWVEHLAWSPDGRWLAASLSRQVKVYDQTGQEVWGSAPHRSTVSALAWSGSEELATACYGRVSFFAPASGEVVQELDWKGSLVSMTLSPDGSIVACGSQDNSVHFWRRAVGEDSEMRGYPGKPSALAFDHTGTLLATGGSEMVTVWSFAGEGPEGSRPGSLDAHMKPITTLAFAHRGRRLASGGRDGGLVVWSLGTDGHGGPVGAAFVGDLIAGLAWRSDDRALAAFDAQGGVNVWRVRGR